MTTRQAATQLLVARVVRDALTAADRDLRTAAGADFDVAGVRDIGVVDGEQIGAVQLVKGRQTWTVTDPAAFVAWVEDHYPDEVQTTKSVRPATTTAILARCKAAGAAVDEATGEEIPGVSVRASEPTLTVKPSADAQAIVARAFTEGRLSFADVAMPAIEATP